MRAPLSWLRDFAPFPDDIASLVATLDDLGLVVEGVERVGEGIDDVVVVEVRAIAPIAGADRIRLVTVETGAGLLEVVCGAWNFTIGDLVPLAPVGAMLPGGVKISRREMKGVTSNGMLCSGRELDLTDDHAGILVLGDVDGARPGVPLTEALGIQPDVVFDITVEGNRPDAWSIAGVARDLAGRLGLPFTPGEPTAPPSLGVPIGSLASVEIEDPDLCPRMVARVLERVTVGPSPRWLTRRLVLAGMRPINNVVDASNYVMLELGQPTHPYDLDRLAGAGLRVRRARRGEQVMTLDGATRTLGVPGRGLADSGDDCVICDAMGDPVGIGGIMGGESSEIGDGTTRVLLEAAYFSPMVIARTSKRLGLRTEASARFERGCDPWGIDRCVARFCELVGAPVADGSLDVRGEVPQPFRLRVPTARVEAVLGVVLEPDAVASLLEPIGFGCEPADGSIAVTVPTDRPDVRQEPYGVADVIEEIARTYGYSRIERRHPAWPQPGRLSTYQRERRLLADTLCGLGALEAWTPTLVDDADHALIGLSGPAVAVTNPIVKEEAWLRRSLLPGLVRALARNLNRRELTVRLFETGTVFAHPDEAGREARGGPDGSVPVTVPGERELCSVVLCSAGDDARTAVAAWRVVAEALRLGRVDLVADGAVAGLHPARAAVLVAPGGERVGALGEIDPDVAAALGIEGSRVGWVELDVGRLLDPAVTPRRPAAAQPVSRFPSSDVDLAFVTPEGVPAAAVQEEIARAAGELLESVTLFDVYRGPAVPEGTRSLAYRLRFCAVDRTLTDAEVGRLRQSVVDAVATASTATLRQ